MARGNVREGPHRKVGYCGARDEPPISAVVCYDFNVNDLVRPVARAGGVLAMPANDWKQIAELHYRSAVWPAVMAGVAAIRATGHGNSVACDPAGRLLGQASSLAGPAVLLADLPILRHGCSSRPNARAANPTASPSPAVASAPFGVGRFSRRTAASKRPTTLPADALRL